MAEKSKTLEPIVHCLDTLGLDKKQYTVFNAFRCVIASLTEMQVELVRIHSYVEKINEIPDVKIVARSDYRVED